MERMDAARLRRWDGILAFWTVLWLVVGVWTAYEIWQLTDLAEGAADSGRSLQAVSETLAHLQGVPVLGDAATSLANRVGQTADKIIAAGQQADNSIRGLAILIGLAVGIGPSGPVLLFYLPARWHRRAERRDVAAALTRGEDAALQAYLASRAVDTLPLSDLLGVSDDPRRDLEEGRHLRLAEAELARLGLQSSW